MRDLGLLLFRVIVGGIFAAHGYPKLFGGTRQMVGVAVSREAAGQMVGATARRWLGEGFAQSMERGGPANFASVLQGLGIPQPQLMAWVVGLAEFGGGLLIALGLLTRLSALLLAIDMVVAIWKVHWRNGLVGPGGLEFPLSLLAACLALLGVGPGQISLTRLVAGAAKPPVEVRRLAGVTRR